MTHSLLDPAVMPENGEVNALAVSSTVRRRELSFAEEDFAGLATVPGGGPVPFTSRC
jgi:hypothetical protein